MSDIFNNYKWLLDIIKPIVIAAPAIFTTIWFGLKKLGQDQRQILQKNHEFSKLFFDLNTGQKNNQLIKEYGLNSLFNTVFVKDEVINFFLYYPDVENNIKIYSKYHIEFFLKIYTDSDKSKILDIRYKKIVNNQLRRFFISGFLIFFGMIFLFISIALSIVLFYIYIYKNQSFSNYKDFLFILVFYVVWTFTFLGFMTNRVLMASEKIMHNIKRGMVKNKIILN